MKEDIYCDGCQNPKVQCLCEKTKLYIRKDTLNKLKHSFIPKTIGKEESKIQVQIFTENDMIEFGRFVKNSKGTSVQGTLEQYLDQRT